MQKHLVVLTVILTIGFCLTPSFQDVFANPSPSILKDPLNVIQSGTMKIRISNIISGTTTIDSWAIYTDETVSTPSACAGIGDPLPIAPSGIKYRLHDEDGDRVQISLTGVGSYVEAVFGTEAPFSLTTSGTVSYVATTADGDLRWADVSEGPPATTPADTTNVPEDDLPDTYKIMICGDEGGGDYASQQNFDIVLPVAGELIPINTTALLLAGIQANTFGILAGLVTIGAVAFGGLYLQVKKNKK